MKITQTTLLRSSLVFIALVALSGCGQKGPLVLEQVPVDQTQAPLENATDQIPVEKASDAAAESGAEEATKSE